MQTTTFLFKRNGFKVYKLTVLGYFYFISEKKEQDSVKRHIRKSLPILEKIIDAE